MNPTEVEVSNITLAPESKLVSGECPPPMSLYPLLYNDSDLVVKCVSDDVQIKETKRKEMRLKPDCDPLLEESWEAIFVPSGRTVALLRLSKEMEQFWCKFYESIAVLVEEMDRKQGTLKSWKEVNGHRVYEGLWHILTWTAEGECRLFASTKLSIADADSTILVRDVYRDPVVRKVRLCLQ